MHGLNQVIWIILIACFIPYVFAWIARFGLKNVQNVNHAPREYLANATGLVARANAVQQNSFEGLPLFIAAILMAEYLVVAHWLIVILGGAYLFFRIGYGVCYLADWASLRSIFWLLATCCPILLFYFCMNAYRFVGA